MDKEIIKIMPDYDCFPLWKIGRGKVENIDPKQLLISEGLRNLISNWQKRFDSTLNQDNPLNSGFKTYSEEESFEKEGMTIWRQLVYELGDTYTIKYFSVYRNKIFK